MTTRKTRKNSEIKYTEKETSRVAEINILVGDTYDRNLATGKIVAEQVEEDGGTAYGEQTLERLSQHPDLKCSGETLRRCWRMYQLMTIYGDRLRQAAPSGKYGHFYALSRLLKITDVAEQEKAVIAMAEQSEGCLLTADELEAKVTVHLASIDKAIKPKPAEPKAENRDATDPVYGALFESTKTAYESVEQIIKVEAMRQVAKVIKAANRLGFAYCALLERLALESGEDASESAHKMINSLNAIIERRPQRANQDSLGSEEIKKQSGSTCRVKRTGKLRMISDEPSTILGAEAAKLLDWPQESGMKVVLSAQALKEAVKRASLAAMTEEGQSELFSSSNDTRGCVRIAAKDGKITFESSVSRFCARHVVDVGNGDAVIVSEGETCVPAKELKKVIATIKGGGTVSMAFVPVPPNPDLAVSDAAKAVMPNGALEIGTIGGDKILSKTGIEALPAENFSSRQYPEEASLTVIMAGKVSSIKGPVNSVGFCVNPTDTKEIYDNYAIFPTEDSIFFLGSDGRRCAVAQVKADAFDQMLGADTKAPILVDMEFLKPIMASLYDNDPIIVAVDDATQKIIVTSDRTSYCVNMVAEALRMKYPNYTKVINLESGAVFLVNRERLAEAEATLNNVIKNGHEDRVRHTFAADSQVVTMIARCDNAIKDATSSVPCKPASEVRLKSETVTLNPKFLIEGLKRMSSENVMMTFTPNEHRVKVEDEADPKFAYYLQVGNPNEA